MRLVEQVGVLHKAVARQLRRQLAMHTDRPYQQLRALRAIARSDRPCTQAVLAEKLMIDAAAASRLVDRLVTEGLVKRGASGDRRSVRLAVTRAAARDLALFDDAVALVERRLVAAIGAREAARLATALGRLGDALARDRPNKPA